MSPLPWASVTTRMGPLCHALGHTEIHSHAHETPLPSKRTAGGLIPGPISNGCGFNDVPEASRERRTAPLSCSALATEPSPKGTGIGQKGKTCDRKGREQGRKGRRAIPKQRTRSPLNSKTIVLATRNYWGGKKFKREQATLRRSG